MVHGEWSVESGSNNKLTGLTERYWSKTKTNSSMIQWKESKSQNW